MGWIFILKKLGRKGPRSGKFDRLERLARHIACRSRDSIAANLGYRPSTGPVDSLDPE